ncbi:hypothetical protein Tco_1422058, partial [Tanacetum coccineum]
CEWCGGDAGSSGDGGVWGRCFVGLTGFASWVECLVGWCIIGGLEGGMGVCVFGGLRGGFVERRVYGFCVMGEVLILIKFFQHLFSTQEWLGLSTHPTSSPREHLDGFWRKYTWLGLNWRRNGQDYNSTPKSLEEFCTVPGDGVAIPSDAVISYKRRRQDFQDGVRT